LFEIVQQGVRPSQFLLFDRAVLGGELALGQRLDQGPAAVVVAVDCGVEVLEQIAPFRIGVGALAAVLLPFVADPRGFLSPVIIV